MRQRIRRALLLIVAMAIMLIGVGNTDGVWALTSTATGQTTPATTNVTYRTIGFTATAVACADANHDPHVGVEAGGQSSSGNSTTYTFSVPDSFLRSNCTPNSNGKCTVYVQSIMQVFKDGVPTGSAYYTPSGIAGAANWKNKSDFASHWDWKVEVDYPAPSVEYHSIGLDYTIDSVKKYTKHYQKLTNVVDLDQHPDTDSSLYGKTKINGVKGYKVSGSKTDGSSKKNVSLATNHYAELDSSKAAEKITTTRSGVTTMWRLVGYRVVGGNSVKINGKEQEFLIRPATTVKDDRLGTLDKKGTYKVVSDNTYYKKQSGKSKKGMLMRPSCTDSKYSSGVAGVRKYVFGDENKRKFYSADPSQDVKVYFIYAPVYDPVTIKCKGVYLKTPTDNNKTGIHKCKGDSQSTKKNAFNGSLKKSVVVQRGKSFDFKDSFGYNVYSKSGKSLGTYVRKEKDGVLCTYYLNGVSTYHGSGDKAQNVSLPEFSALKKGTSYSKIFDTSKKLENGGTTYYRLKPWAKRAGLNKYLVAKKSRDGVLYYQLPPDDTSNGKLKRKMLQEIYNMFTTGSSSLSVTKCNTALGTQYSNSQQFAKFVQNGTDGLSIACVKEGMTIEFKYDYKIPVVYLDVIERPMYSGSKDKITYSVPKVGADDKPVVGADGKTVFEETSISECGLTDNINRYYVNAYVKGVNGKSMSIKLLPSNSKDTWGDYFSSGSYWQKITKVYRRGKEFKVSHEFDGKGYEYASSKGSKLDTTKYDPKTRYKVLNFRINDWKSPIGAAKSKSVEQRIKSASKAKKRYDSASFSDSDAIKALTKMSDYRTKNKSYGSDGKVVSSRAMKTAISLLNGYNKDIKKATDKCNEAAGDINSAEESIAGYSNTMAELEEQKVSLTTERDSLQSSVSASQSRVNELRSNVSVINATITSLERMIQQAEVEGSLEEAEQYRAELSAAEAKLSAAEAELSEAETALDEAKAALSEAETELDSVESSIAELTALIEKKASAEKSLKSAQDSISKLEEKRKVVTKALSKMSSTGCSEAKSVWKSMTTVNDDTDTVSNSIIDSGSKVLFVVNEWLPRPNSDEEFNAYSMLNYVHGEGDEYELYSSPEGSPNGVSDAEHGGIQFMSRKVGDATITGAENFKPIIDGPDGKLYYLSKIIPKRITKFSTKNGRVSIDYSVKENRSKGIYQQTIKKGWYAYGIFPKKVTISGDTITGTHTPEDGRDYWVDFDESSGEGTVEPYFIGESKVPVKSFDVNSGIDESECSINGTVCDFDKVVFCGVYEPCVFDDEPTPKEPEREIETINVGSVKVNSSADGFEFSSDVNASASIVGVVEGLVSGTADSDESDESAKNAKRDAIINSIKDHCVKEGLTYDEGTSEYEPDTAIPSGTCVNASVSLPEFVITGTILKITEKHKICVNVHRVVREFVNGHCIVKVDCVQVPRESETVYYKAGSLYVLSSKSSVIENDSLDGGKVEITDLVSDNSVPEVFVKVPKDGNVRGLVLNEDSQIQKYTKDNSVYYTFVAAQQDDVSSDEEDEEDVTSGEPDEPDLTDTVLEVMGNEFSDLESCNDHVYLSLDSSIGEQTGVLINGKVIVQEVSSEEEAEQSLANVEGTVMDNYLPTNTEDSINVGVCNEAGMVDTSTSDRALEQPADGVYDKLLFIPDERRNDIYDSDASAVYCIGGDNRAFAISQTELNSLAGSKSVPIIRVSKDMSVSVDCNSVRVYTPVACSGAIAESSEELKEKGFTPETSQVPKMATGIVTGIVVDTSTGAKSTPIIEKKLIPNLSVDSEVSFSAGTEGSLGKYAVFLEKQDSSTENTSGDSNTSGTSSNGTNSVSGSDEIVTDEDLEEDVEEESEEETTVLKEESVVGKPVKKDFDRLGSDGTRESVQKKIENQSIPLTDPVTGGVLYEDEASKTPKLPEPVYEDSLYYYKGYGERDYSVFGKQIIEFPFEVYLEYTDENGNPTSKYYCKDGKVDLTLVDDKNHFTVYVPSWAECTNPGVNGTGYGEVIVQNIARNAPTNASGGYDESICIEGDNDCVTKKNADSPEWYNHYVAESKIPLTLAGKMFGFSIIDVGDYPLWESVFRDSKSLLSGNVFCAGTKLLANEEGVSKRTSALPMINGSHPTSITSGTLKTGYVTRFKVRTVGSYYSEDTYLEITPKFYFVPKGNKFKTLSDYGAKEMNGSVMAEMRKDGVTTVNDNFGNLLEPKAVLNSKGDPDYDFSKEPVDNSLRDANRLNFLEVDITYNESINGKKVYGVPVDSNLDLSNVHYVDLNDSKFKTADGIQYGVGVSDSVLKKSFEAAKEIAQSNGKTIDDNYKDYYSGTKVKDGNNTYWTYGKIKVGSQTRVLVGDNLDKTLSNGSKLTLDSEATNTRKSVQDWYCTYYLPSDITITPKDPMASSAGVDLTNGYLVVNFDVKIKKPGASEVGNVEENVVENLISYNARELITDPTDGAYYDESPVLYYGKDGKKHAVQVRYDEAGNRVPDDAVVAGKQYVYRETEVQIGDVVVERGRGNMWENEGYTTSIRRALSNDATEFAFCYGDVYTFDVTGSHKGGGVHSNSGASSDYRTGGTH